jgi:hypothetical protein
MKNIMRIFYKFVYFPLILANIMVLVITYCLNIEFQNQAYFFLISLEILQVIGIIGVFLSKVDIKQKVFFIILLFIILFLTDQFTRWWVNFQF